MRAPNDKASTRRIAVHAESELQFLAARRVPVRIEPAHKIDRAPHRSPGAIVHVGTYVGGATLDLDFILADGAIQTLMLPSAGSPMPINMLRAVDFPAPLGPISA